MDGKPTVQVPRLVTILLYLVRAPLPWPLRPEQYYPGFQRLVCSAVVEDSEIGNSLEPAETPTFYGHQ